MLYSETLLYGHLLIIDTHIIMTDSFICPDEKLNHCVLKNSPA